MKPEYGYELFEPKIIDDVRGIVSKVWFPNASQGPMWCPANKWDDGTIDALSMVGATFAKPIEIPEGWELVPLSDEPVQMGWRCYSEGSWNLLSGPAGEAYPFSVRDYFEKHDYCYARKIQPLVPEPPVGFELVPKPYKGCVEEGWLILSRDSQWLPTQFSIGVHMDHVQAQTYAKPTKPTLPGYSLEYSNADTLVFVREK